MNDSGFERIDLSVEPIDTLLHEVLIAADVLHSDNSEAERVQTLENMQKEGLLHIDVDAARRQQIISARRLIARRRETSAFLSRQQNRAAVVLIMRSFVPIDYEDE